MFDRLSALIKLICYFEGAAKRSKQVPPGAEKAIHLNYARNSSGQGQYGQSNALEDLRGGARDSRSCCCCCCPCRVSSICAMSLNSRSQENAMLRCVGHVHRLTDTVGAAKPSNPSIDTLPSYCSQLIIETTAAATAATCNIGNIGAFLARSPLQMASIALSSLQSAQPLLSPACLFRGIGIVQLQLQLQLYQQQQLQLQPACI